MSVAVLEDKGLVRREDDPDDRRAKLVVLTKEGTEAIHLGRMVAEGVHDRWEAVLGARDMERLVALLDRLDAKLRHDPEGAPS